MLTAAEALSASRAALDTIRKEIPKEVFLAEFEAHIMKAVANGDCEVRLFITPGELLDEFSWPVQRRHFGFTEALDELTKRNKYRLTCGYSKPGGYPVTISWGEE